MPNSLIDITTASIDSSVNSVVDSPLTQFYQYNARADIKQLKEAYIKSTCPNFERWKHTLDSISYCKRSDYGNLQLSPHFKVSDYCKGSGNTLLVCMKTIQILETIWNYFGKPVYISSGYRDPAYNRRVGGANGSMHMWGLATDIKVHGLTAQIVGEFIAHYFEGCEIGVYGHSDMRNSGNWVHVAPRNGYSDYNRRITGSLDFKNYKASGQPEDPIIYTDGLIPSDGSTTFSSSYSVPSIDYKNLHPYIVTVDRNTDDDIDYLNLKEEENVVGVMVEAGHYFTSNHQEVSNFKSPKLEDQIAAITEAKLPFALYMTARARTEDDVVKEVRDFSYIYRKYSPGFGVWLKLDFTQPKSINDKLIKKYYSLFYKHGLKDRVGFYVDEKQLEKITWEDFQNEWYLWIVKHVDDVTSLDALLDPNFFDMDGDNPPADWAQSGWNFNNPSISSPISGDVKDVISKFINCIKENGASAKDNEKLHQWVIKYAGIPRNLGWCAATMFAAAVYCGLDGVIFPGKSDGNKWSADTNAGFCMGIINKYGGSKVQPSDAQVGDIFQIPMQKNGHCHVGVISEINGDGTVTTVEGNIAGVKTRKLSVFAYCARPNWSKVVKTSSSSSTSISNTATSSLSKATSYILDKSN